MSLDWDATKVADVDNLTDDERVTLHSLTFSTIAVGIGEITEDNVKEFYSRLSFWEKINGASRHDGTGEPLYFTPDEVKRFVGLRTNVFPKVTTVKFVRNVYDAHERWNVSGKDWS